MAKRTLGAAFRDLINVDLPEDAPVTEQTIAHSIWTGMSSRSGSPIPIELRDKIKKGMSHDKIEKIVKEYKNKKRTAMSGEAYERSRSRILKTPLS